MSVQQVESNVAGAGDAAFAASSGERGGWFAPIAWLAIIASAAVLLGRLLYEYGQQLWSAEHYQFFPMLLTAVAWLGWRRYQSLPATCGGPASLRWRVVLWGTALLLTAGAVLSTSPLGAAVALLSLLLAAMYELGGRVGLRHFLPVWGVLLLLVRLPFGWDQAMIVALQKAAATWASGMLDLLRIRHLAEGVVVRLPERDFFIEEACSGVHSLFATLAFLAVFAVVARRGLIRFLFLLAAAVFWVLVANTLRILAVVILSARYNLPVVEGVGHEITGVVIFALVIGLLLSTDRLFLFIVPQREQFPGESDVKSRSRATAAASRSRTGRGFSWSPACVAIALTAMAIGYQVLPARADWIPETPYASSEGFVPVSEGALPESWNGWEKVGFQVREREKDDLAGEISRIWYFRKGRINAAVSIDGPFTTWHDTEVCYDALGYMTQSCDDHAVKTGDPSAGAFTELAIAGPRGEHGYVLFMAYTEAGIPLRPPATRNASIARMAAIWRDRVTGRMETPPGGRIYQVQVFARSGLNFTAAEREELQQLFHSMRTEIAMTTAAHRRGVSQGDPSAARGEST